MANRQHVEALVSGWYAWDQWRDAHPNTKLNLTNADLRDADLRGVDLNGMNLKNANLEGANLSPARIEDFNLVPEEVLEGIVEGSELNRMTMLINTDLTRANLRYANLRQSHIGRANLSWAILQGAMLGESYLVDTNLRGADLRIVDFGQADLRGVDFAEARIGWTKFSNNDLSTVKGLDSVVHVGPSTIGIDTLYRSAGNIPEIFLRGCGVPDEFIIFARSLIGRAIGFYSCFISYSSKNHDFAEHLHADLQSKGVRCWFAPEDIKIGDKFRQRIDEAIRIHDKLLVILSEDSISSAWVEEEVESAIEREHREKRLILFPVRIDDAVINSDQAWAASLRRMRHIGDFSKWKDDDSYQKAFARLLRDLKAKEVRN